MSAAALAGVLALTALLTVAAVVSERQFRPEGRERWLGSRGLTKLGDFGLGLVTLMLLDAGASMLGEGDLVGAAMRGLAVLILGATSIRLLMWRSPTRTPAVAARRQRHLRSDSDISDIFDLSLTRG